VIGVDDINTFIPEVLFSTSVTIIGWLVGPESMHAAM